MSELSHVDESSGAVQMVDVGAQAAAQAPRRRAGRRADGAGDAARLRDLPKGDALATAQLAGIMARQGDERADPALPSAAALARRRRARGRRGPRRHHRGGRDDRPDGRRDGGARRRSRSPALTVYDMAKAIDKEMAITEIALVEKTKEPVREGSRSHRLRPRLARGGRRRAAATCSRSSSSRTASRSMRRLVPDERDADRPRDRRPRRGRRRSCSRRAAPVSRRATSRPRRPACARARGARHRRGDPRGLDREDAPRPALARRRRDDRLRARRQPRRVAGRAAATATRCCGRRFRTPSSCWPTRQQRPTTVHT